MISVLLFSLLLLLLSISSPYNVKGIENETISKEVTLQDCYNWFTTGFMILKFLSVNESITNAVDDVMFDPEVKKMLIESCEFYKMEFGHYINKDPYESESKQAKELNNKLNVYLKERGLVMPESLKKLNETTHAVK